MNELIKEIELELTTTTVFRVTYLLRDSSMVTSWPSISSAKHFINSQVLTDSTCELISLQEVTVNQVL